MKLPLCKSYDTTSFSKANIFNHTSQDEAIFHMHTFSPLISTFCHQELVFFTCMVHFPWYHQEPDSAGEIRTVCSSLCHEIRTGCKFAMSKINFHWPEKISCEKFGNESTCVAKGRFRDQHVVNTWYKHNINTLYQKLDAHFPQIIVNIQN